MIIETKEVQAEIKIVLYGPPRAEKKRIFYFIYNSLKKYREAELLIKLPDGDRLLFSTFYICDFGNIKGLRISLFSPTGEIKNPLMRLYIDADGIIFITDSDSSQRKSNIIFFKKMLNDLSYNKMNISDIPIVFLYNKRDTNDIITVDTIQKDINNKLRAPWFEVDSSNGYNIISSIKKLLSIIISKKYLNLFFLNRILC